MYKVVTIEPHLLTINYTENKPALEIWGHMMTMPKVVHYNNY